jgi:hypothetical protein
MVFDFSQLGARDPERRTAAAVRYPAERAMQSQIENYRKKAREFARLAAVAKSRRDARHCRKFADMYWALALGDEPMRFQPPQKPAPHVPEL